MKAINKTNNTTLAENVEIADTFFTRLKGLMFSESFGDKDALLVDPCNSIHCCFVRFPIDVIFLDKNNKIRRIYRSFKPWRFTSIDFKTKRVLELPEGVIGNLAKVGDEICIS